MQHRTRLIRARALLCSAAVVTLFIIFSSAGGTLRAARAAQQPGSSVSVVGILPFAGDVFTIGSNGSLIGVDPSATPPSAPLFNLAGSPLDLTWGAWSAASADGGAFNIPATKHPATIVGLHFKHLVPRGVYSVFYRTFGPDTNNPRCPNVEPSLALHSLNPFQKPDAASFVATAGGEGWFVGLVAGDLLAAQQVQYSLIYHFDGHTYGDLANRAEAASQPPAPGAVCHSSYGIDAMRQTLIIQK